MKLKQARAVCEPAGLELVQVQLDIPEIQAESGEPVAKDKATKAYALLQKPVIVSDDSWMILGLHGFPGPYMKSVSDWFTIDDWLHLTQPLQDRRIILRQIIVYQDEVTQHLISRDITGILLKVPRGTTPYPHSAIVSFDDGAHSNAEFHERGESALQHFENVWHDFVKWYKGYAA